MTLSIMSMFALASMHGADVLPEAEPSPEPESERDEEKDRTFAERYSTTDLTLPAPSPDDLAFAARQARRRGKEELFLQAYGGRVASADESALSKAHAKRQRRQERNLRDLAARGMSPVPNRRPEPPVPRPDPVAVVESRVEPEAAPEVWSYEGEPLEGPTTPYYWRTAKGKTRHVEAPGVEGRTFCGLSLYDMVATDDDALPLCRVCAKAAGL